MSVLSLSSVFPAKERKVLPIVFILKLDYQMGSLSGGLSIGVIYSLLLLISTEECSWVQKMTKRDVKMVVSY